MDIMIPDKWLFVCSANYVRSPTAEYVARNRLLLARSCGTHGRYSGDFVVTPITREIVEWADVIVCMEQEHVDMLKEYRGAADATEVYCWNLPDDWAKPYDPQLVRIIEQKLADTLQLRMIGQSENRAGRVERPDAGD